MIGHDIDILFPMVLVHVAHSDNTSTTSIASIYQFWMVFIFYMAFKFKSWLSCTKLRIDTKMFTIFHAQILHFCTCAGLLIVNLYIWHLTCKSTYSWRIFLIRLRPKACLLPQKFLFSISFHKFEVLLAFWTTNF